MTEIPEHLKKKTESGVGPWEPDPTIATLGSAGASDDRSFHPWGPSVEEEYDSPVAVPEDVEADNGRETGIKELGIVPVGATRVRETREILGNRIDSTYQEAVEGLFDDKPTYELLSARGYDTSDPRLQEIIRKKFRKDADLSHEALDKWLLGEHHGDKYYETRDRAVKAKKREFDGNYWTKNASVRLGKDPGVLYSVEELRERALERVLSLTGEVEQEYSEKYGAPEKQRLNDTSDALGRVAAAVAEGQLDGKRVAADLGAHLDAALGLGDDDSDKPPPWLTTPSSPSPVVVPQYLLDRSREARERHTAKVRSTAPIFGPPLPPRVSVPPAPARVVSTLAPPAPAAKQWSTKEINAGILKQRRELIGRKLGVDPNSFSVTREIHGTRRALGRSAFTLPRKTIEGLGMLIKGKNRAAQSAAVSSVLFLGVVAANETRMDGKGLWLVEKPGQVAVSAAILFGYSVLNTIGLKVVDRFEERRASGYPRVTLRERAASSALARRRVEQAEKGRVARVAGAAPTVPTLKDWSSPRVASFAKESSLDLSPEQVQSVMVKLRERVLTGGVPDKALVLDVISDVKREDDGAASAPKP